MAKELIIQLILTLAPKYNIDPDLVKAVVQVESKYNAQAVGPIGERGLMQLHPKYYEGDKYFDVELNLETGIKKLAKAKKHCAHKLDKTFVVCYNAGVTGGSRLKNPKQFDYYVKVMKQYNEYKQERKVDSGT